MGMVKFEARIKELVENLPDLVVLVEPLLIVRRVLREQIGILHRRLAAAALHWRKPNSMRVSFLMTGKDFVRIETTLMKEGQSAVGTKLESDSPAYKALVEKRSYTGPATLLGKDYQANYAPLIE